MDDKLDDYEVFAKQMETKFPKMFSNPYGGFCVGKGWWPIVETLCVNIQEYTNSTNQRRAQLLEKNEYNLKIPRKVKQVVVAQIKEKFGGLRFYYDGGDEYISGLVRMAESWAGQSCETCGAPGSPTSGGWIKTLCSAHRKN